MANLAFEGEAKQCRLCGTIKPISEFHQRLDGSLDGYRNECKVCRCNRQQRYAKTQAGRLVQKVADKVRHERFPHRRAARGALYRALAMGRVKPLPCWMCGDKAEAHHPNYDAPLDVVWLCKPHHKEIHRRDA